MSLTMTLGQYQNEASQFARYPGRYHMEGLLSTVLGLAGEAGRLTAQTQHLLNGFPSVPRSEEILEVYMSAEPMAETLGSILWYVQAVAEELGYALSNIAAKNLEKLADDPLEFETPHRAGCACPQCDVPQV